MVQPRCGRRAVPVTPLKVLAAEHFRPAPRVPHRIGAAACRRRVPGLDTVMPAFRQTSSQPRRRHRDVTSLRAIPDLATLRNTRGKDHTVTPKTKKRRNPIEEIVNPPHVPQRCGAKARSTGQPCRKWACFGKTRCRLHGGAWGSGRPQIHGRRSVQAKRNKRLLRVVKFLLKEYATKPEPIDPPESMISAVGAVELVRAPRADSAAE